ncbi:MAG TPA: hypothetical protein VK892_07805 [Pyrinomonadaceae bacterium]|nr:hypothetical protein [Pyrinomonadaceae bacterium]
MFHIGKGIGGVLESKSELSGVAGVETAIDAKSEQWLSDYEPPTVTNTSAAAVKSSSPASVTEGTTRNLIDFAESKRQGENQG